MRHNERPYSARVEVDELCHQSALPIPIVSSTLAMLELKGLIRQAGAISSGRISYKIRPLLVR
jgi:predicted Rossmann fold nucleotide-binding protein DprA/Smf involved in DNA uptake